MGSGVFLAVERVIIAVSVVGAVTVVIVTGHLTTATAAIFGPLVGAVAVYVSAGHVSQVQASKPAAATKEPTQTPKA